MAVERTQVDDGAVLLHRARPLGTWIGLILTGSLLVAGVRLDDHPATPIAVTAGDDDPATGAATSVPLTTTSVPLTTTTIAGRAEVTARPRPGTTTTTVPSPSVPTATAKGVWLVEGSTARLVAPDVCGNMAKSFVWRSDNQGVLADYTGTAMHLGLDGSIRPASPGYRHTISNSSDRGAYLDQSATGRQVLVITGGDLERRVEIDSSEHGGGGADIVISPDGRLIALFDFFDYLVVDSDGNTIKPWGQIPIGVDVANVVSPSPRGWTTDGAWIVLAGDHDLLAMRPDGSGAHALGVGWVPFPLQFGPGSSFAFDQNVADVVPRTVRIADAAGAGSRVVAEGPGFGVAWSRRGGLIAWSGVGPGGVTAIHTATADGGVGPMLLRAGSETVWYTKRDSAIRYFESGTMAWSADGSRLLAAVC